MSKFLISRKKRPLDRDESTHRDARLIVIATEGSKTEQIYFRLFGSSQVKVLVIPSKNGKSSPDHVLDNLRKFVDEFQIGLEDELWVVVDRDAWKIAMLKKVASHCFNSGYHLAVSNPTFELWLALHLDAPIPVSPDADSLEEHLKQQLGGYNKSKYNPEPFLPGVDAACQRALAMDKTPLSRWPHTTGTRVYKLLNSILNTSRQKGAVI
jgi:hypothetical protein